MPNPSAEDKAEIAKLCTVRAATVDDVPFIRDAWKNQAYKHLETALHFSRHGKKPAWSVWTKLFPNVIDRILAGATVDVLVLTSQPDQILAFAVTERLSNGTPVLHWVSTKKDFWRHGFAERLLRARGLAGDKPAVFTFAGSAYPLVKGRIAEWEYVPFWLFALGTTG